MRQALRRGPLAHIAEDAQIIALFSKGANIGEIRVRHDKRNGDLTSWLPSSQHLYYFAKGWRAVQYQAEADARAIAQARA